MLYVVKFAELNPEILPWKMNPTAVRRYIENGQEEFFIKLEESIKREGIRNPIHVESYAYKTGIPYGGSRLYVAKKLKLLTIPCIISDYANRFPDAEILNNEEDIRAKFMDQPGELIFHPKRLFVKNCPHIHL